MEHWILQMEEVLIVQQVSSSTLEYDGWNLLASINISLFPVVPLFVSFYNIEPVPVLQTSSKL